MTLTFTDRGTTPGTPSFRALVVTIIATLAIVIVGVAVWSMVQGPQLRGIVTDESTLHQRSGVTLTLLSDRAIQPVSADQIRVTPAAPFTLEDDGLGIHVTFSQPLLADTQYQVEVLGLRPQGWGQEGSWIVTVNTEGLDFLYLRDSDGTREIHRARPGVQGSQVIYRAEGIVSMAPVASVLAVLREVGDESWLELVDPSTGLAERIATPPGFEVVDLANAAWGTTLVTIANVSEPSDQSVYGALVLLDVLGDRTPRIATGIAGEPLSVRSVEVSGGSGEILVWQKNRELVRFNPLTEVVLPLGTASELWGFDALGSQALYVDALGTLSQDLSTGQLNRVPRGEFEGIALRHQKFVQTPSGLRIHRAQLPGLGDGDPFSIVTREDDGGIHHLVMGALDAPGSIGDLSVSPNGQFLLVEVNSASSPLGYQGLTAEEIASGTVVRVIDLRDNSMVGEFPGFGFVW